MTLDLWILAIMTGQFHAGFALQLKGSSNDNLLAILIQALGGVLIDCIRYI